MEFILNNLGTIITGLVVAAVVTAITIKLIKDKRKGKCAGGCASCAGCPRAKQCAD